MVAITVILAAVIAVFVMDIGDDQSSPLNAHVSADVGSDTVELTVTEAGDADEFILRGAGIDTDYTLGDDELAPSAGSGFEVTDSLGPDFTEGQTVNIVAKSGDQEENAGSFEVPEGLAN